MKACVACGEDLSAKKKYEKITLCSVPLEIITVWEELLKTQESNINPQDLFDNASFHHCEDYVYYVY